MISVVVPIYNVEQYIVKCLQSIVNQDYRDFELVLVNDGTKDNSIALAIDYLKDKQIDYQIINKVNGGLASARNAGLANAKGEYVNFIDADDCVSIDFLSRLISGFKDETDYTFCSFKYVKNQSIPIDDNDLILDLNRDDILKAFLKRSINFVVPSMMFKKSFLLNNNLLFDEKIKFSEDQPFVWNVILHTNKCRYVTRKMYGYYLRQSSIMTSSSVNKIVESHEEYKSVINSLFDDKYRDLKELIISRWQLGALYTSARILNFNEYTKVYKELNGKTVFRRVYKIGEIKAILLGMICSLSIKLMYRFCNILDLNK